MRTSWRTLIVAAAVGLGLAGAACASSGGAGPGGEAPEAGGRPEAGAAARKPTPAERAAARVARITVSPDSVELRVGDSVRVGVTALDSAGHEVDGAPVRVFVRGLAATWVDSAGVVVGRTAGTATLYAVVAARPPAGPAGLPSGGLPPLLGAGAGGGAAPAGAPVSARATIRVRPLPVVKVELREVPGTLYAGARVRLSAAALSRQGERGDAELAWRSSDTSVVAVSPFGLARPRRPGTATITASSGGVEASRRVTVAENPVRSLAVTPAASRTRVGDPVRLEASALDARGRPAPGVPVAWSVQGPPGSSDEGARLGPDGTFVAERPGLYAVTATVGERTAVAEVSATPRGGPVPMEAVAHASVKGHASAAIRVFRGVDGRDYAYTGTRAAGTAAGNVLYAWDVTDPGRPRLADSVALDARVVGDVEINETRNIAVATRQGAPGGKDGIVLLDVRIPAHPRVIAADTADLPGGVEDVAIAGNLVYAVSAATPVVHVLDISDPAHPRPVGRWEAGGDGTRLHHVSVQDGLAYVTGWSDALIVLDVGAGVAGGTPTRPAEVSRYAYPSAGGGGEAAGDTHAAVRYGDYVFTSEEVYGCAECGNGPRGTVHVLDVSDLRHPRQVATFRVPEAGPRGLWAGDGRLYVASYQGGVRVVDITGRLRGDLYRQGRQIGSFDTASPDGFVPNAAMAVGVQAFGGAIFASDLNSGLWVLKFARGEGATAKGAHGTESAPAGGP